MMGHSEHPIIPGGHPDLVALQDEVKGVASFAVMKKRLESAPTVVCLELIPADATLTLYAQPTYDDLSVVPISFLRSPAPFFGGGEAEWFLMRDGEQPRPGVLLGACTPGGAEFTAGIVKGGVGFGYCEVAVFRSSEDAPPGLLRRGLPAPETLDDPFVAMNMQIGQIVRGTDGRLYWRMLTAYYETGPVRECAMECKGFGGRFYRR